MAADDNGVPTAPARQDNKPNFAARLQRSFSARCKFERGRYQRVSDASDSRPFFPANHCVHAAASGGQASLTPVRPFGLDQRLHVGQLVSPLFTGNGTGLPPTRTTRLGIGYRFSNDTGRTPFTFDRLDVRQELRLLFQTGGPLVLAYRPSSTWNALALMIRKWLSCVTSIVCRSGWHTICADSSST